MPDDAPGSAGRLDLPDMPTIQTWVNDGAGGVQQASFTVHLDQLPTLREGIQQARDKLFAIHDEARSLGNIPAPGNDEVSRRAVENLGERAKDTEGGLMRAINDGVRRLQDILDQIDAISRTYQQADQNSRM
ncbi:hypothetical protein LX15_002866 [Streptoalloteichus tenebrarius]|uniref:PE domain-containing protein n=1 Tax=Streptoalloteichus tenebrarius (strain ATCC 17920 / DSM 40477 / JCM 4838 / CBS 697.72 / NBRC 16177 / NCIMB 11028 / NRRL B-12390 / A12253. 1 / ISP 5477) TaxID=1933 RepID=A0ABT1HUH2_STRSD|nr:hypothetical protein [Streptoalloteichus tenebrarius]MCP2259165.1 hypothetical protein [Streptoalloteichus tenebrarius]BFF04358.1 hypothetical protein GCM10020241_60330 [Streptoalloteichus tenebrarius]